jgi:hypothetical protein
MIQQEASKSQTPFDGGAIFKATVQNVVRGSLQPLIHYCDCSMKPL